MSGVSLLAGLLAAEATSPNIIIFYADDLGYGDIGCYGATAVDRPSIDQLARNGIRFTSAYATASTCTPSRFDWPGWKMAYRLGGPVRSFPFLGDT